MRWFLILGLSGCALNGQVLLEPSIGDDLFRELAPMSGETAFRCEVRPIQPRLDFSLRYQSGYRVRFPLRAVAGEARTLNILVRITAASAAHPFYVASRFDMAGIPNSPNWGEIGGGFLVGTGSYRTEALIFDEHHRVCRASWRIHVPAVGGATAAEPPADTVAAYSFQDFSRRSSSGPPIERLTVLVHAAPANRRLSQLQGGDVMRLTDALASLLERLPARHIRVTAFNLEQQKIVFDSDDFTAARFRDFQNSLHSVELGKTSVEVLANPDGPNRLLARLVNRELAPSSTPPVVVFLGPEAPGRSKVPPVALPNPGDARFFYLEIRRFRPPIGGPTGPPGRVVYPDAIESALKHLKGKLLPVWAPQDFAKAIERISNSF